MSTKKQYLMNDNHENITVFCSSSFHKILNFIIVQICQHSLSRNKNCEYISEMYVHKKLS